MAEKILVHCKTCGWEWETYFPEFSCPKCKATEDIYQVPPEFKKLPKPISVLKAMLNGHQEVTFNGYAYAIIEDEKEGLVFVSVCTRTADNKQPEKIYFKSDLSINQFIKECNKLTDNEIFVLGAQAVLTKEAYKKAEERLNHAQTNP